MLRPMPVNLGPSARYSLAQRAVGTPTAPPLSALRADISPYEGAIKPPDAVTAPCI